MKRLALNQQQGQNSLKDTVVVRSISVSGFGIEHISWFMKGKLIDLVIVENVFVCFEEYDRWNEQEKESTGAEVHSENQSINHGKEKYLW